MSARVWTSSILAAVVIVAAASYAYSRRPLDARLRSRHSMPAVVLPARTVAITAQGKLFHYPSCRYIHGKPELVSAQEAEREGYTPCTRCMRKALQR